MAKANAQTIFTVTRNFPDGTTTTPEYTGKSGDNGIEGVVSAGPMPDPNTLVACLVQTCQPNGQGGFTPWENVGGLTGSGGMISSTKGGPLDTPVTITATTESPFQPGWKARGVVTVANAPAGGLPVSFAGNV